MGVDECTRPISSHFSSIPSSLLVSFRVPKWSAGWWSRRGRCRSGDDEGVVVVVVAATAARLSDSLSLKELADWEW